MADELLPIKVVFPSKADERTIRKRSRLFPPIVPVDTEMRAGFSRQIETVRAAFAESFAKDPGSRGVASIQLRPEAILKTKRPKSLFNENTCPVIGTSEAGQLFVSVSDSGLSQVQGLLFSERDEETSHVSTIQDISPYSPVVSLEKPRDAKKKSPGVRVELFEHRSNAANLVARTELERVVQQEGATIRQLNYGIGNSVYKVEGIGGDGIEKIRRVVGVESVTAFASFQLSKSSSRQVEPLTPQLLPPPIPGRDYGVVGIIDSGTDPYNPLLQAWVHERYDRLIPTDRQDWSHGSFVAGLIASGRLLNNGDPRFPSVGAKVVDVVAVERDGELLEDDLMDIIDDALSRFPYVKVWNLSLSLLGEPCKDASVYRFSAILDARARKHDVLFVIASGNFTETPLGVRIGPSSIDDRIRPPADCVRGLTVGGLAHTQSETSVVAAELPSPFSRRGPASMGLIKPELMHYAGNCDRNGGFDEVGVRSVSESGSLAESIGVSFACPSVAAIAAEVRRELDVPDSSATATLVKAMMVHASFVKGRNIDARGSHYSGVGCATDSVDVLNCVQSSATVLFHAEVSPNPWFSKNPFPMPACLHTDKGLRCELFMTLLYDCDMDYRFGLEYCRRNVTASLGTYRIDPATGQEAKDSYSRELEPVPSGMKTILKKDTFELGYQWSPLKLYYKKFTSGPVDKPWRLTLSALDRGEYDATETQSVVLLVTIRTDNAAAHVYDELVQEMTRLAWSVSDIQVRSRQRGRP